MNARYASSEEVPKLKESEKKYVREDGTGGEKEVRMK